MFDRLLKLFRPAPQVRESGGDLWADAYIRPVETTDRWTVAARADLLVARLSGCFDIAINMKATAASGTKLRLYRKTRSKKKAIGGKRRKFLMGELSRTPHGKTVSYAQDMGDVEEVTSGPVIDFMHRPNPWMTGAEWTFLRFKAREATGNAYSFVYADGKAVEAYWMPPQCVRIIADDEAPIAGYRFSRNMTDWLELLPESVFHTKLRPSLQDFRIGETWVHGILKQLDTQEAAFDSELARQRNMQRPDFAAVVKGQSTKDQKEEVRKVLRNDHRGPAQAGRSIVLGGDISIVPLGWAPKDLENSKLFAYIDEIIWRAAGIPESVAKLNDANLASAEVGQRAFMRTAIQPLQNNDAVELTDAILPLFNITPGEMFFAYDDCVPEDEAAETVQRVARVNAGLVTLDEARAEEGMEPYAKGLGSVPRVNGVPVQTQEQIDSARQAQADALHNSARMRTGGEDKPKDQEATKAMALALLTPKAHAGKGVSRVDGKDFRLPVQLEKQLEGLSDSVQRWLRSIAAHARIGRDGKVDLTEFRAALQKALDAHLYEVLRDGGVDALRQAGSTASLASNAEAIRSMFDAYTFSTAAKITESTRLDIESTILRMVEDGTSVDEAARAIRSALPETAKPRAEMIARTEASRAYGTGNLIGWVSAGPGWKLWKLAANPCEECQALVDRLSIASSVDLSIPERLRGQPVVALESPFTETNYGPVYTHPLHPNCYCDVLFVNETTEMTPEEARANTERMLAEMRASYEQVAASISDN